jgi:hypothetical protein
MSVTRYQASFDIHTPTRKSGPPFEQVERAVTLALLDLQLKQLKGDGRVDLVALEVEDFTIHDRPTGQGGRLNAWPADQAS